MNLNLKWIEKREKRSQISPENYGGKIQVQSASCSPGSNFRGTGVDPGYKYEIDRVDTWRRSGNFKRAAKAGPERGWHSKSEGSKDGVFEAKTPLLSLSLSLSLSLRSNKVFSRLATGERREGFK